MTIETVTRIIAIVFGALGVVLAIVQTIRAKIAKNGNITGSEILGIILDQLMPKMVSAECTGMTGEAKKVYVKSQIMLICSGLGIKYDDVYFDKIIEKLIDFSKSVNAKESKTVTTTSITKDNTGYGQV